MKVELNFTQRPGYGTTARTRKISHGRTLDPAEEYALFLPRRRTFLAERR